MNWPMAKCPVSSNTRNKLNAVHQKRNDYFKAKSSGTLPNPKGLYCSVSVLLLVL